MRASSAPEIRHPGLTSPAADRSRRRRRPRRNSPNPTIPFTKAQSIRALFIRCGKNHVSVRPEASGNKRCESSASGM